MAPMNTLLRHRGAKPLLAAGLVGRLPMGVVGLGLTLMIVGQTGSFGLAGAISATTTLVMAAVGPYNARLADRIGQTRALPVLVAVNVASFLLLTLAVTLGWPVPLWFAFAICAGASMPALGAMVRARWVRIADNGAQRSAAFAIEAVADELSFVVGPLIATALALALFPAAPVLAGMAALLVGGLALALQRGTAPPPGRQSDAPPPRGHVIGFAGVRPIFAMMLSFGAMFGLLNMAVVAFAEAADPSMTGVLLSALSFGSLVSGIVLGTRTRTWSLTSQVRAAALALTLGLIPLAVLTSPWVFALVAFCAGLAVSTTMIATFALVERMVPKGRITEGLAFVGSGLSLGMAPGALLAGVLIDYGGPAPALALAAACAAVAAATFWSRSAHLATIEAAADLAESQAAADLADAESPRPHAEVAVLV